MSALSELLARKAQEKKEKKWESHKVEAQGLKERIVQVEETQTTDLQDSSFVERNIFPTPDSSLLIAIYTPFLRKPAGFQTMEFRAYKNWLLGDTCYVLNTFKPMDTTSLRKIYLSNSGRYIPDSSAFHRIACLLWDLELTVPDSFREIFEGIAASSIEEE